MGELLTEFLCCLVEVFFAIAGRQLWAGGSYWYGLGAFISVASALFTFKNDFLMNTDAGVTTEQARRARKRIDEKADFIKKCIKITPCIKRSTCVRILRQIH